MAYQVLARKYRPLRFADVVGQDHVTRTLLNALAQDRIAHGYIFSGHRGIGKTTIARILASALNCQNAIGSELRPTPEPCLVCNSCLEIRSGNSVDMLEIDAATNRGIDEIRELRDAARYRPARDRFKIILLDEAHQITDAAFNALLKTLEEPPEHIVFMMATTQPEDIPQTIRSRCQHFSFHAVKLDDIVGQLRLISTDESIDVDDATLGLLAEAGDGSMRDALSIMDQAIASAPQENGRPHVELTEVRSLMGSVSNVVFEEILTAVHANDSAAVLHTLGGLLDAGNGAQQIARQFVRFLRNCVVAKITAVDPEADVTGIAAELLQISTEERRRAARSAQNFSEEELSRFLSILLRTFDDLGYRQEQRLHLELGLLKLVHVQRLVPIEELLSQLGATPPPRPAPTTLKASSAPTKTPGAPSSPTSSPSAKVGSTTDPATPPQTAASPSLSALQRTKESLPPPTPIVPPAMKAQVAAPAAASAATQMPNAAAVSPRSMAATAVPEPPTSQLTSETQPTPDFQVPATEATPFPTPLTKPSIEQKFETAPAVPAAPKTGAPSIAAGDQWGVDQPEASDSTRETLSTSQPNTETGALQVAVVAALSAAKGQTSAAEQLEDATWHLRDNVIEIQTTLSKTMLPVLINAEAERLMKAALREANAGHLQIKLLPGVPETNGSAKTRLNRPAAAGSAAELAERHPMVQEAKRLFGAEISNVIDLRGKG